MSTVVRRTDDELVQQAFAVAKAAYGGDRAEIDRLREALTLPLLFYGQWTEGDVAEWQRITGSREGTTKVMCDHIRKVLA
jgi:hypothetical protein